MFISCNVILEACLASNMSLLNSVSWKSALQCAAHICLVGHQCGHKVKKPLDWRRVLPIVWRIHCLALYTLAWYALIFYTAELEPCAKPLPERHWKLILERGWQTCWIIQNKLTVFWKHRCQDFIYLRVMYTLLMRGQIPQLSFPPVSLHNCGDCGAHCAYAVFSFFK